MPRIIVKCRYYSSAKSIRDIGGMLKYIATREGVEKLGDGWQADPVTKRQEEFIMKFCETHKGCKRLPEYHDYALSKTKGTASELISSIIENYPQVLSDKTYLDYIATRPRAERIAGTHGLFTSEGVAISLEKEAENLRNFNGNVFTVIVSLKRHDAERLGYNNAERWRSLVQSRIDDIAKEHRIPPSSLKWFGAFHNEAHHPHIHLMLYSTDRYEKGYIDNKGIGNLRHLFGTEIFADDLDNIYKEQTEYRNQLNDDARDEINAIAEKIKNGLGENSEFVQKFVALAKRLQTVSGKKVYGYLPKNVKAMVNELVDLLEEDEDISRIYELWYEAKCAVYGTYTDNAPPKKPLSEEEAFKPIRNAIIKEADELGRILHTLDSDTISPHNDAPKKDDNTSSEGRSSGSGSSSSGTSNSNSGSTFTPRHTQNNNASRNQFIASSVTRLGGNLAGIFKERFNEQADQLPSSVDSKLKREIEAKKRGQSLSM